MARVRLFANLREAAGASEVALDGATVGEVLDHAAAQFGPVFAAGLPHAKVWVNGDPAEHETAVGADDEIALIPPVSGGAMATTTPQSVRLTLAAALGVALAAANSISLRAFVVALVAVAGVWLWDLAGQAAERGLVVNVYPLFGAIAATTWGAFRWGFEGYAFGVAIAIALVLVWALVQPTFRTIESLTTTSILVLVVAIGAGPLVLIRLRDADEVFAFMLVVAAAVAAAWLAGRFERTVPMVDPNLAALAAAVLVGAIVGSFWGPGWSTMFVAAVVAAAGLVSGRVAGSLLRAGRVYLVDEAPGYLGILDGPFFAAGLFWLALALLT